MRKFCLLILLLFFVPYSNAQVTEGHVHYSIFATTDNPELQSSVEMFQNSVLDIYFSGDKTRTELDMKMIKITTIVDNESNEVLVLSESMTDKNAVITNIEEIKNNNIKQETKVTLTGETKNIAGYKCKKAILTDGSGNETVCWYTGKIKASKEGQQMINREVPGFPLEFESVSEGIKMRFTATKVTTQIETDKSALFDTSAPEGFKVLDMEEQQN